MSDLVHLQVRPDGVGLISLNRPDRLNALSTGVVSALHDAIRAAEEDAAVRSIVVVGVGRVFCAGADIEELATLAGPDEFGAFVHRLTDAFGALAACPKPSVAALHGVAMGGGLELALACDMRVAEEGVLLGVPEVKLGVLPGAGGTARLPRLLPDAVVRHMLMTGEPLLASRAYELGLVNEVVAVGAATDSAVALASVLAAMPPRALGAAKVLVEDGRTRSLEEAIDAEREMVSMLFGLDDRVEGVQAFLDKRNPSFEGR